MLSVNERSIDKCERFLMHVQKSLATTIWFMTSANNDDQAKSSCVWFFTLLREKEETGDRFLEWWVMNASREIVLFFFTCSQDVQEMISIRPKKFRRTASALYWLLIDGSPVNFYCVTVADSCSPGMPSTSVSKQWLDKFIITIFCTCRNTMPGFG